MAKKISTTKGTANAVPFVLQRSAQTVRKVGEEQLKVHQKAAR